MKQKSGRKFYVGVDIGGTKIAAGLVDSAGRITAFRKRPTPHRATGAQIAAEVKKLIRDLLKEKDVPMRQVRGIGMGVPGIVEPNHRDVLVTPNVGLARYPLASIIQKAFKVKVVLGNDVNLGVLGEKWFGIGRGVSNIVGLFPGTGVGGAIIIDGKLITGAQGAAGELGHMTLDMYSSKESAGLYGTLEALASRRAIERDIKEAILKGKKSIITKLCGKNLGIIKSSVIAEALHKKDRLMVSVIDDACRALGQACISLRHVLNPDMIILGGGVMEACGDYMLPRIRKISAGDSFFEGIDRCRIEASFLGDDAIILGAVALLKQVLGERMTAGTLSYPKLQTDKSGNIFADGKPLKKNIYIRADGKIKKINGAGDFDDLRLSRRLGIGTLKRVCKRKPRVLIVGSAAGRLPITGEGKQFLKDHLIEPRMLKLRDAVRAYNTAEEPKAVVMYRKAKH